MFAMICISLMTRNGVNNSGASSSKPMKTGVAYGI